MNNNQFMESISKFHPCEDASEWLLTRDSNESFDSIWKKCHRSDWMLWLAAVVNVDRKILVSVACDCAENALKHEKPEDSVSSKLAYQAARESLAVTRLWIDGKSSIDEVNAAANAAYAAASAYAYAAYTYAADAADAAADNASDAASASAYAAANAGAAAASANAAAAASAAADAAEHLKLCEIIKNKISSEMIEKILNQS